MGVNAEKEEKRLESEIDVARKDLEMDVEKREQEAKEKLDDILSEKKMEFCARCGKKIGGRVDWAGKCLWSGCEKLLCRECWDVKKYRFCKQHSHDVYGKSEEKAKKKEFFKGEDEDIKVDLRAMLEGDEDSRLAKLQYFASEYARWMQKRLDKDGPIDWTPTRFLQKARMEVKKQDSDWVISISVKRWFWKKVRLSIVVTPFDARGEVDINGMSALLQKMSRRYKGYKLFVLVSDSAKLEAVNFVNRFADSAFSLYMVEPRKGNLYFNIKDPITQGYSGWFNQKKEPYKFKVKLKRLADLVSGRMIVSEKIASKEFGFREKDVQDVLKSCPFLSHIKGTDTFFWKED
jgi:hypothetical protein